MKPAAVGATMLVLILAILAPGLSAGATGSEPEPPGFSALPLGVFRQPTDVAFTPADPSLLFVTEQRGDVKVMVDGHVLKRPFLDIRHRVRALQDAGAGGGEQGLLSIAFAPDYAKSRAFYVYFTDTDNDLEVDRFRRSRDSRKAADRGSRKVIIVIPHLGAQEHNGGSLAFGPDHHLYLAPGDAGTNGVASQDRHSLLGKVLRIQPLAGGGYRVPGSNPFVGGPGRDEIYAMGLRNPYRFSIDNESATIAIGDVGQSSEEEIDFATLSQAKAANFGWPRFEGNSDYDPSIPVPAGYRPPILAYPHGLSHCVVTAGPVVRGPALPDLRGRLIYGDLCDGDLRSFEPEAETGAATDDRSLGLPVTAPVAFAQGLGGRLYVASIDGTVYEIAESD